MRNERPTSNSQRLAFNNRRLQIERGALTLVAAALLLTGCRRGQPPPVERAWTTMGTVASITLPASQSNQLNQCVSETVDCFQKLDDIISVYVPGSKISEINSSTGMVAVGWQTLLLLQISAEYAAITDGAFDPTIAPLIQTWGFSGGEAPTTLPAADEIASALKQTGYGHMKFEFPSPGAMLAGFDQPGMSVDLGGIAKGYAVDAAHSNLSKHESLSALINLGGNIRSIGSATAERPWRIGVRNPFDGNQLLGSLTLEDGMSVATSGNYERFITLDGKRYAHIIDPRSGYPVQGMAGVTVLSSNATEADAISTALFVVGVEGAPALLAKRPKSQALLVPDRTPIEIWVSPGFEKQFTPLPKYKKSIRTLPGM